MGGIKHNSASCLQTDLEPMEERDFTEGLFGKNENQRLGKNRKKLSIEEKSMAIGWRQNNISNSEIS